MLEILNGKDDDCDGLEDEGFNDSDADGDGLSDWEEFHIHGTNPEILTQMGMEYQIAGVGVR